MNASIYQSSLMPAHGGAYGKHVTARAAAIRQITGKILTSATPSGVWMMVFPGPLPANGTAPIISPIWVSKQDGIGHTMAKDLERLVLTDFGSTEFTLAMSTTDASLTIVTEDAYAFDWLVL